MADAQRIDAEQVDSSAETSHGSAARSPVVNVEINRLSVVAKAVT